MMLDGKVVLITGGAGLLGSVFAEAVLANGGIAVIGDISTNKIESTREKLSKKYSGCSSVGMQLDITSKESVQKVIKKLSEKYGKIDALVNNAYPRNKNYGRKFELVEYGDFCENISLHLGGYFLVSQQYCEYAKSQGEGNIVFISSIYGFVAPRFSLYDGTDMTMPVEYAAIKAGVQHLSRYIAAYYKGHNIRSNVVCPGGIVNGQPKQFLEKYKKECSNKGMLAPEDLCGTLVYLLSDSSRYVNGQAIVVDDGFSL